MRCLISLIMPPVPAVTEDCVILFALAFTDKRNLIAQTELDIFTYMTVSHE